jgi:cell division protein FtsB
MKIIPLTQQLANDLLVLITSDALAIKASAAARVHELQVALAQEPSDFIPLAQVNAEHGDYTRQLVELGNERTELVARIRKLEDRLAVFEPLPS